MRIPWNFHESAFFYGNLYVNSMGVPWEGFLPTGLPWCFRDSFMGTFIGLTMCVRGSTDSRETSMGTTMGIPGVFHRSAFFHSSSMKIQ